MKRKAFFIRTDKQELSTWIESKQNISSFIESELDKIRTGFYVEKAKAEEQKEIDLVTKRKKNLKLDLENWNTLKSMNFKQEQIIELLTGKITIESLARPTLAKEEKQQFDFDFNCSFCGHKHCSTGLHACLASICNCGIRG